MEDEVELVDEIAHCVALASAADSLLDDVITNGDRKLEKIGHASWVIEDLIAKLKKASNNADLLGMAIHNMKHGKKSH